VPGYGLNRDPERSPMRWDASRNAGFTSGQPYLAMGPDVTERNVARLQLAPRSLLWLYRSLIRFRKSEPALIAGAHQPMRSVDDVLMFMRMHGDSKLMVALNFASAAREIALPGSADLLMSSHLDREPEPLGATVALRADEGVILRLRK